MVVPIRVYLRHIWLMDEKEHIPWWFAGLFCRCPNCGKGALFEGILKFRDNCAVCGDSFTDADAGDGPAVIVITLAGAVLVPILLILMFAFKLGPLAMLLIMAPLSIATCIVMLRPMKATLFALQRHKKAGDKYKLKE